MATNFASAAYLVDLQELLDRHNVGVTVRGFRPGRDYNDLDTAVAELVIDDIPCGANGAQRSLDGVLNAGLLIMRRLDADEAEEAALELAVDVATALIDECEDEDGEPLTPVMGAGPIIVTNIAPEQPDAVLRNVVCGWLVSFQQQWRFTRTNQRPAPAAPVSLLAALGPDFGPGATYRVLGPAAQTGDEVVAELPEEPPEEEE